MKRLVKQFGEPSVLTTDKAPALLCAFKKLQKDEYYTDTKHCTVKYLNNFIEQDYRHIKRRFIKSSGFQSIRHASRTIKGIETLHAIYKQKRSHILKKALASCHATKSRIITADGDKAYPVAIQKLKEDKRLPHDMPLRVKKYLNNVIEQDHRFIKKRIRNMLGLKSYQTARKMIDGIEAMYMIKKGQTSQGAKSVQKQIQLINHLFDLPA